jgi:hypothetical protein
MSEQTSVVLNGREAALAQGATFMARHWKFRTQLAQELLRTVTPEILDSLENHIHHRLSEVLSINDMTVVRGSDWTEDYIRRRAAIDIPLELDAQHIDALRVSLLAAHSEFGCTPAAWVDFRVAAPGNAGAFGTEPADLSALATRMPSG